MEKVTILHTNDLHSHFENWPKLRRFIEHKQRLTTEKHYVLTVDLGDFSDRVHPLTEATHGKANVRLMNQAHYDAVTIGNNEGLSNTKKQLEELYNEADFPVVISNFSNSDESKQKWYVPYQIFSTQKGTKIGVIGLTAPFPFSYTPLGWQVAFPDEVLPNLLHELKSQTDVIVLMSHLGYLDDEHIASHYPEIDIVIGAHTHHLFEKGKYINDTLLAAAGKFGQHVGEIVLEINDDKKIIKKVAQTYLVQRLPQASWDNKEVKTYQTMGRQLLSQDVIGELPTTYSHQKTQGSSYIQLALDALEFFKKSDIYLLSTGLFLGDLKKGRITRDDLHQTLPHPVHLIEVSLTGKHLIEVLDEMVSQQDYLRDHPIIGMGFRGKVFGELVPKHLERTTTGYLVDKQVISLDQIYRMVMIDHYAFIKFFPKLTQYGSVTSLCPSILRNVVAQYIEECYPINNRSK